jgi:hypothetical protein
LADTSTSGGDVSTNEYTGYVNIADSVSNSSAEISNAQSYTANSYAFSGGFIGSVGRRYTSYTTNTGAKQLFITNSTAEGNVKYEDTVPANTTWGTSSTYTSTEWKASGGFIGAVL